MTKLEDADNDIFKILDGDEQCEWDFNCLLEKHCHCDGHCREFIKLREQLLEVVKYYAKKHAIEFVVKMYGLSEDATNMIYERFLKEGK